MASCRIRTIFNAIPRAVQIKFIFRSYDDNALKNSSAEVKKMKYTHKNKPKALVIAAVLAMTLAGCGSADRSTSAVSSASEVTESAVLTETSVTNQDSAVSADSELFSERDLNQTPDLSDAEYLTVSDGQDISVSEEGIYVLSGSAEEVTVTVDAADDAKVQIVLDGVSITNKVFPAIYVKNADKVFITTTDSENVLTVTGEFTDDESTGTDGVIFSKDDLVLNGVGTLTISSTENGVVSKDDLKITGGTYYITASSKAFEANDSILIADGAFTINAGSDGFHAENDDDNTQGAIVIEDGTFSVNVQDDAIHGQTTVTINGGTFDLTAGEGIESTQIEINGGALTINATDDGINAGRKSTAYDVSITINDVDITVVMANGDTDAIDSNGNLYVNGGTINISAQSAFDYDGVGEYNGGTIIVNGQTVNSLSTQMMGGRMNNGGQRMRTDSGTNSAPAGGFR